MLRRLVTIPVAVIASLVLLSLSPLLLLVAAVADLATGWRRRRFLRLSAMALQFAAFELVALVAAGGLWVVSGFGFAIDTDWSQRLHYRLQAWWTSGMLRAIQRWFGMDLRVEGAELIPPGPILVIARHTSFGDAIVPAVLVGHRHRMKLRYVLKRELVNLPSFDVVGNRLPNHFVDRTPDVGAAELTPIRDLAVGLDERGAAVIYPEGTFYTPERHDRALVRLRARDPRLAARAEGLRHLLPPRPGGILALLDGAPDADLVVIGHRGFEPFISLHAIVANVPFRDPVDIVVWRVDRRDVPTDDPGRIDWLYDQWERMEHWIEQHEPGEPGPVANEIVAGPHGMSRSTATNDETEA